MKKLSRRFYVPTLLVAMLAIATTLPGFYHPPAAQAQSSVRYDDLPDLAEYLIEGRKWSHTNLTYFFQNGTNDIGGDGERQAIRDAFALWSGVTPLTFTEVSSAAGADIVILWGAGSHGDSSPFDGVNGVLAHAFYPPPNSGSLAGDAHFDDSETWTLSLKSDTSQPLDLVTVAAHEVGHSLGLGHSQVAGSLMYPFYGGSHRFLHQDDINGIQVLYPHTQPARMNMALSSNGATARAKDFTPDGVFPGAHFQPSYATDGQRYAHLAFNDAHGFWRDEHGLPTWLEVSFNGPAVINEVNVFTTGDYPALLTQADPSPTQTFSSYGATAFDVQYWTGSAWATVPGGSITGNTLVWRKVTFPALTTTKMRVVVNAAADGVARVVEFEAWGFSTRTNVALAGNGGVVTAQNYTQDGVFPGYHFYPSYAADGRRFAHRTAEDADGFWRDEHGLPTWLEVAFNGSKTIDEVDIFTLRDYPAYLTESDPSPTETFTQLGVTAFNVQYWTGGAWQTVPGGSVTGNNLVWRKLNFAPVTTNKIRVVVNAAGGAAARIVEVEAWGTPAAPQRRNVASASGGASAAAKSYTQDGVYPGYHFYPSSAIDGLRYGHLVPADNDIDGFWRDEHGLPTWLEVNFGGQKMIDEVDIFTIGNYPAYLTQADPSPTETFTQLGVTAFDVQYWSGTTWVTVPGGSITGNDKVWRKITFPSVTTSKIRVVVNAAAGGVARVAELEAWGLDAP